MKHYEVTIENGRYPLTYKCDTIAEVYGCLTQAATWAPRIKFDPDELMEELADMRAGNLLSRASAAFRITVTEGEV